MAAFNKFNNFVQDVGAKVHNLTSDTLKVMLTDTAPLASNHIKTDITEIAGGNGYTAGGTAMTGTGWTNTSGTSKLAGSNVVFTASGGSIAQFRYAVLYNSTAASGNLIGWFDYGAEVNVTNGNTFSILPADTTDILQIS